MAHSPEEIADLEKKADEIVQESVGRVREKHQQ